MTAVVIFRGPWGKRPGSIPAQDTSLIGGHGFESYHCYAQFEVVPAPMLASSYVMGMHVAGGGQSIDTSAWQYSVDPLVTTQSRGQLFVRSP